MRFAPRLSVGQRLTFTMVLVVVLSLGLGAVLGYEAMRHNLFRPAPRTPPPGPRGFGPGDQRGDRPDFGPRPGERPPDAASPGPWPGPPPAGGAFSQDRPGGPQGRPDGGPGPRRQRRPPPLLSPFFFMDLGIGIVVALVAGLWLSRRFTRPLAMLAKGAGALGAGDFSHKVPVAGDDEFGRVAASMNRMAERIGAQIEELQADSRRRQQLLADVAHELRSPVATLKTMAEALRDGIAAGPERSERATRAIVESAARMERLMNDLMDLARLDLDEFPLHPAPVDLRFAAVDCVRRHGQAAESAGIHLHPVAEGTSAMVSADPHRLAQVLDNLLDNAISHAGSGAEVWVAVEPGDPVTVSVTDTGRGIPAEQLPYLFDAFYRGDAARTPGGRHSGLGLRIARALAQAHGGDLRVDSTEGLGTRATLTLPALDERTSTFR